MGYPRSTLLAFVALFLAGCGSSAVIAPHPVSRGTEVIVTGITPSLAVQVVPFTATDWVIAQANAPAWNETAKKFEIVAVGVDKKYDFKAPLPFTQVLHGHPFGVVVTAESLVGTPITCKVTSNGRVLSRAVSGASDVAQCIAVGLPGS